jgi:hypothetical protein
MNDGQHENIVSAIASMALAEASPETACKAVDLLIEILGITSPTVPIGCFVWRAAAEILRMEAGEEVSLLALKMLDTYETVARQL